MQGSIGSGSQRTLPKLGGSVNSGRILSRPGPGGQLRPQNEHRNRLMKQKRRSFLSWLDVGGVVTIVGSARSSCSALHSRLSIPLRSASQLFSYPVFRTGSRGRVKLHKNRAISPKKIVPSFRACPWGPFGKRGLEGGADKPVGDCRQNSVVWNWSGGRSENVGAQCGVRKPLSLVFREGPRGWQRHSKSVHLVL